MIAKVINNNDIILSHFSVLEEDAVIERFTVTVNARFMDKSTGGFNGVYKRYDKKRCRLPRPFLGELLALCRERDLPIDVQDERPPWRYNILPIDEINGDFLPGITLEEYQIKAIRKGCCTEVGIFNMFPGSGKTEVAAGLCKAIPCPTVILADQRIVIDQIKARLLLREVVDEIGLFYAGRTPSGQSIIIGSVQSLVAPSTPPKTPLKSVYMEAAKQKLVDLTVSYTDEEMDEILQKIEKLASELYAKALIKHEASLKGFKKRRKRSRIFQEIVKKAEMLIVDECDMAASNIYKHVFRYLFRGRRRYGLSGTPFTPEKPVDNLFVKEHLGSEIVRVGREEVESRGRIVPLDYTMIAFGDNPKDASTLDIAIKDNLTENPFFHRRIASICNVFENDSALILVERDNLGHALQEAMPGSLFIHGKTPKKQRDKALVKFQNKDVRILIGGKILRRGLDVIGGFDLLILATGGKMWSTFLQQLTRAVRLNSSGKCKVVDFLFLCNKYMYNHSRVRLKSVVGIGYDARVIFQDGQQLDGQEFIASRFRQPRPRK